LVLVEGKVFGGLAGEAAEMEFPAGVPAAAAAEERPDAAKGPAAGADALPVGGWMAAAVEAGPGDTQADQGFCGCLMVVSAAPLEGRASVWPEIVRGEAEEGPWRRKRMAALASRMASAGVSARSSRTGLPVCALRARSLRISRRWEGVVPGILPSPAASSRTGATPSPSGGKRRGFWVLDWLLFSE